MALPFADLGKIDDYDTTAQQNSIDIISGIEAANAVRKYGDLWYCIIIGGTKAGMGKNGGPAQAMFTSFKRADEIAKAKEAAEKMASIKPKTFDDALVASFDTFMNNAMQALGTTGAAVAIVQDGKVVLAKGYGSRVFGQNVPVTEKTLFMLGSVSKIFTGYLAAEAVRQNKLTWDSPMHQILPEFKTGSEALTKQITFKHTLSMSSSLPRRDMVMPFRHDDAAGVLKQMEKITPIAAPGLRHIYSNHSMASAGYAAARAFVPEGSLDDAWKQAIQTQVLDPLGMTTSTYDYAKVQTLEYASPTAADIAYLPIVTPMSLNAYIQGFAPAGGLWSNAEDIAKYMIAELNQKDPVHLERKKPVMPIDNDSNYCIGIMSSTKDGVNKLHHSGVIDGYTASIELYPDQNFGIAVMINNSVGILSEIVGRFAFTLITSPDDVVQNLSTSMTKKLRQTHNMILKHGEATLKDIQKNPDPKWLESLVGNYTSEDLGNIEIKIVDGKGIMKTQFWETEFVQTKKNGDTFVTLYQYPYSGKISFKVVSGILGKVNELVLIEDQAIAKYEYTLTKQ